MNSYLNAATEMEFQRTHPWLKFEFDTRHLDEETWMLLGEAVSKLDHVASTPLLPSIRENLEKIYITKGAHATTRIEGNTLTEEQVRQRLDHRLKLPPSREYQGVDIDNILACFSETADAAISGTPLPFTTNRILEINERIWRGQDVDFTPGEIRTCSVEVRGYLGAPARECEWLLDRLSHWISAELQQQTWLPSRHMNILAAILAHLYIAWIHPFEDGNGRTARMAEYQLLLAAGAPIASAHLLSNHYHLTRDRYYAQLDAASRREPYSPAGFIKYALQGFVDGLKEQLELVNYQQLHLTWESYVNWQFRIHGRTSETWERRKSLLLALSPNEWTPRSKFKHLNTDTAGYFHAVSAKTVSGDVNKLLEMGLIEERRRPGHGSISEVRLKLDILQGYLSPVADMIPGLDDLAEQ